MCGESGQPLSSNSLTTHSIVNLRGLWVTIYPLLSFPSSNSKNRLCHWNNIRILGTFLSESRIDEIFPQKISHVWMPSIVILWLSFKKICRIKTHERVSLCNAYNKKIVKKTIYIMNNHYEEIKRKYKNENLHKLSFCLVSIWKFELNHFVIYSIIDLSDTKICFSQLL